jgi:glucose/arabinose dehydrogenase
MNEVRMHYMSRLAVGGSAILLVAGCAKSEQAAKDSASAAAAMAAAAPAPAPAPAAPSLSPSDLAGKWQMQSVPETGKDTTPTKFVLTWTSDSTAVVAFPSGVKVKQHVSISGDSVMMKSDEFPSQRRKGVKVRTDVVSRVQGGRLVGMTTAHYKNAGADSVLRLRTEGTKMP